MAENKGVCLGLFHPTYRGYYRNPMCNWIRGPTCTVFWPVFFPIDVFAIEHGDLT